MPAQEVGEAFVAIRAIATGFREQAQAEVNQALSTVRERATVPIRAQVDTTATRQVGQSFQPVIAGARQMGTETEGAYRKTEAASHHAFETIRTTHDGIRARFGETLRAASLMGGGVALAYGAFTQGRQAIQVTNELAHSTQILTAATGLSARQASGWISIAQTQGVSATQLQTGFNGLARATTSADNAFAKAGASAQQNLGRIHAEQVRVTSDTLAYNAAVAKYTAASPQAASAAATLASAQNTLKGYVDKTTGSLTGAAAAFDQLGISQQQLHQVQGNLPAELDLIANKFQAMGAGTDRATVAQQLFGRGSSVLIPILAQGASGIQKNIDVATQYGATLSGSTLKSMDALRQKQQQLSLEMEGMRVRIATALEPALISVAGVALHLGNVFLNVVTAGIHAARGALNAFMGTQVGQGLATIVGDAGRFASQIRDRFVTDLTRPVSFGRLFSHFETDLTTWLPRAASRFWTQLNQDLFAPGREVTPSVPIRLNLHARGEMTTRTAGAGIFPGMNWASLGERIGGDIVRGMEAAITQGRGVLTAIAAVIRAIVNWITNGGGAAVLISGALRIADALVHAIFDPRLWIANWQPILDLALIFFSDGFATVGREALGRIGEFLGPRMLSLIERFGPEWVRTAYRTLLRLPEIIGEAVLNAGIRIGDHLPGFLRPASDAIFSWAASIPTRVLDLFSRIPGHIGTVFASLRGRLADMLDVGFIGTQFLRLLEFIGKLSVADAVRTLGRNIVLGIWGGITGAWDWFIGQIEMEWHKFIHAIEDVLGISSPSTVAMGWARDIVEGFIQGLGGLPVIGGVFRREFAAVELIIRAALSYIRNLVGAEVNYFRAWVNLIGDLLHGRWSHIWSDIQDIFSAGIRLVNSIFGGLPGDLLNIADNAYHSLIGRINDIPGAIRSVWNTIKSDIGGAWSGIISTLKGWVDRMISPVNDVLGFLHLPKLPTFAQGGVAAATAANAAGARAHHLPQQFATGGITNGVIGAGQDGIYRAVPGGMLKMVEAGHPEAIVPLDPGQKPRALEIVNEILNRLSVLPQAQGGGIFDTVTGAARSVGGAITGAGSAVLGAAGDLMQVFTDPVALLKRLIPGIPQLPGTIGRAADSGMSYLENHVIDWIKGRSSSGLVGRALHVAQAMTALHEPYLWGGGHAGFDPNGPWDCSGAWSELLHAAGAPIAAPMVSGAFMNYGKPGPGPITIYANPTHVYGSIAGKTYGTSASNPGGGFGGPLPYGAQSGFAVRSLGGGGVVPGYRGQPQPAILHGQEVVFTPDQMRALSGRSVHIDRIEINNPATGEAAAMEFLNSLAQRVG